MTAAALGTSTVCGLASPITPPFLRDFSMLSLTLFPSLLICDLVPGSILSLLHLVRFVLLQFQHFLGLLVVINECCAFVQF